MVLLEHTPEIEIKYATDNDVTDNAGTNSSFKKCILGTTFLFALVAVAGGTVYGFRNSIIKPSQASSVMVAVDDPTMDQCLAQLMEANMMSGESKSGKSGESKSGKTSKSKASKSSTDTTTTPATTTPATTTTTAATTTTTTTPARPSFGLVGDGVGFCLDANTPDNVYDFIRTVGADAVADDQGCFNYCEGLPLVATNALVLGFELGTIGFVAFCDCLYNNGALPDDLDTPAFREANDVALVDDEADGTGPIARASGVLPDGVEGLQCFSIEREGADTKPMEPLLRGRRRLSKDDEDMMSEGNNSGHQHSDNSHSEDSTEENHYHHVHSKPSVSSNKVSTSTSSASSTESKCDALLKAMSSSVNASSSKGKSSKSKSSKSKSSKSKSSKSESSTSDDSSSSSSDSGGTGASSSSESSSSENRVSNDGAM